MPPRIPTSTYRLQLGPDLTFEGARRLLPYLDRLGVDTLYLSPIFRSAGGGGYHVIDPTRVDPELGGDAAFDELAEDVRSRGMGILLDIVPNHMKATEENPWWSDVLRRGRGSPFARFFDIDWDAGGGKLVLPVLTEPGAREEDEHTIRLHWREGLARLNYRRFFDITDLVCLRQEDPAVFAATHELVIRLVREGKVTGLRVDHVDGLRDPQGYLERLRKATGVGYLVVEKILAHDEDLPEGWPVEGTTGYEVADAITGVLTDADGAAACDALQPPLPSFDRVLGRSKYEVLRDLFPGEVARLTRRLHRLTVPARHREITRAALGRAILALTVRLGVYRTYARKGSPLRAEDRRRIERALSAAGRDDPPFAILSEALTDPSGPALDWLLEWQLLTGPAMAKGFEDTALYRHTALVSRNDVGGDPGRPPPSPSGFHAGMQQRRERWPHALSSTSTHDSKRSEDARARIAVLSQIPDEWGSALRTWRPHVPRRIVRGTIPETIAVDEREEPLLLQTLIGAWPLEGPPGPSFTGRIQDHMVKAAREAKDNSSWLNPHEGHEAALREAVVRLLEDAEFLTTFLPFQERTAVHGALNGLSQVLLKICGPGIPDVYQGAELWHLRLVDPDNRAPVDFGLRDRMLSDLESRWVDLPDLVDELLREWRDGRLKLHVTARSLRFRRQEAELFRDGSYVPMKASGTRTTHVLAFARRRGPRWTIAVVSRLTTGLGDGWPLGDVWTGTALPLPADAPRRWRNVLTDEVTDADVNGLPLPTVLRRLPVALLATENG